MLDRLLTESADGTHAALNFLWDSSKLNSLDAISADTIDAANAAMVDAQQLDSAQTVDDKATLPCDEVEGTEQEHNSAADEAVQSLSAADATLSNAGSNSSPELSQQSNSLSMSLGNTKPCTFCDSSKAPYTCPRCKIPYCSVACYKVSLFPFLLVRPQQL